MAAHGLGAAFVFSEACGAQAARAGGEVIAAPSLLSLINHSAAAPRLKPPERGALVSDGGVRILRDVRGQEHAERALEIARRVRTTFVLWHAWCGQVDAGAASARLDAVALGHKLC